MLSTNNSNNNNNEVLNLGFFVLAVAVEIVWTLVQASCEPEMWNVVQVQLFFIRWQTYCL
jgi:hypothetical protein